MSHSRQDILDSIRRLVEALRISSRTVETKLGVSGAQLFVLQKLSAESGLSLNEIAKRTVTHQSSVSVVVSHLESKRLVERKRSEKDARRLEVRLTAKGRALLAKAPSPVQEKIVAAIDRFSKADRKRLASLLRELNARAGFLGKSTPFFFEGDEK